MTGAAPGFDLEPATRELTRLVTLVHDDQLDLPTPCADTTVGDLLDHIGGLALAFTRAAAKAASPETSAAPPQPDARNLGPAWRVDVPARLAGLAEAWRAGDAWEGTTHVAGLELPGRVAAAVAVDELVLHAWDLAMATGQTVDPDPAMLAVAQGFVEQTVARAPHGTPGLFGPPVPVPDDAPLLDRIVGLSGRDPAWRPAAARSAH